MRTMADLFAGGHASYVAVAFALAFALIAAELLLLRRRARRTPETGP
jgi:heme exporter protein CcmD